MNNNFNALAEKLFNKISLFVEQTICRGTPNRTRLVTNNRQI